MNKKFQHCPTCGCPCAIEHSLPNGEETTNWYKPLAYFIPESKDREHEFGFDDSGPLVLTLEYEIGGFSPESGMTRKAAFYFSTEKEMRDWLENNRDKTPTGTIINFFPICLPSE